MKTKKELFLIGLVLAGVLSSGWSQSLNNTIWKGTATVKIPALTPYRDGVQKQYPAVVTTGLTFTLPIEAWFRTSTEFLIVLDQRALGADTERAKLQPLIGSWTGSLTAVQIIKHIRALMGQINLRLRDANWSERVGAMLELQLFKGVINW